MRRFITIVVVILFVSLSANGQNLLLIGEHSYPSTESYTLKSNSSFASNLNVLFAREGETAFFSVNTKSIQDLEISGKLIIYLDDGTVITLKEKENDLVDNISKALYRLSDEDLSHLQNSNINTVRYSLEYEQGESHPNTGSYTASNKGETKVNFPALVIDFYQGSESSKSDSNADYIIQKDKSAPYEIQWDGDVVRLPLLQPSPKIESEIKTPFTFSFEVKPDGAIKSVTSPRFISEIEREVILNFLVMWRFSGLPFGVPQEIQRGTITFNDEFF
ncbi:hypothetical protein G3570_12685 [Balneolaceae bacterium YR4-1]|uniref:TonB C-terminal domain-containing protein n=1 Tax=Halalkalibaculum roseum TaxID=2709311 RepID=A0A6M1T065_9BACT|nr:hypothetical protein [Halalkalibaculum roseum]NGP77496.1 hypothetical protein [Halalkalibaculum roseum]